MNQNDIFSCYFKNDVDKTKHVFVLSEASHHVFQYIYAILHIVNYFDMKR
jgi:hypothetical protein